MCLTFMTFYEVQMVTVLIYTEMTKKTLKLSFEAHKKTGSIKAVSS